MNNLKKISSILMIIILVLNFVPLELLEYINVVSYAEDIIIPEADWRDVYPPDKKMRNKPIVGFDIELVGEGTKSA